MKKYIITDIGNDSNRGFIERIGLGIKSMDNDMKFNVYCLDKHEYIDGDKARKNGDLVEGDFYIEDAYFTEKTDLELMHKWIGIERFKVCPELELVVKVTKIVHDYAIYGITDLTEEEILIKFSTLDDNNINTDRKNFKEGDKILLSKAKLCLDIWGYMV